jgi:hypothetical protein
MTRLSLQNHPFVQLRVTGIEGGLLNSSVTMPTTQETSYGELTLVCSPQISSLISSVKDLLERGRQLIMLVLPTPFFVVILGY